MIGVTRSLLDSDTYAQLLKTVEVRPAGPAGPGLAEAPVRPTRPVAGRPAQPVRLSGVSGTAKALFLAGLVEHGNRQLLVVTHSQLEAEALASDIAVLAGAHRAFVLPAVDLLPYENTKISADLASARGQALLALLTGEPCAIMVPVRAMGRRTVPPEVYRRGMFVLNVGQSLDMDDLLSRLVSSGYEILPKVEGRGQAAVRGGLVDIYPHHLENPVRVEFYGDEIESIRSFDCGTQRSTASLESVTITPAREFLYDSEVLERAIEAIQAEHARVQAAAANRGAVDRGVADRASIAHAAARDGERQLSERIAEHIEAFRQRGYFDNDEQYLPLFYRSRHTIFDWNPDALLVIDEPERVREGARGSEADVRETYASLLEAGLILPSQAELYFGADELMDTLEARHSLSLSLLSRGDDGFMLMAPVATPDIFSGRFDDLVHEIKKYRKRRYRVVCAVSTADRRDRLVHALEEQGIVAKAPIAVVDTPEEGSVTVVVAELSSGMVYPEIKLLLLTDGEIYGRQKKRRRVAPVDEAARISTYTDLRPGDYVVHVNHGVGRYAGVQTLEVGGVQRDYLLVEYAGEDKVYVPTDQVVLLQKYIGMDEAPPRLSRLGGAEWARAKSRARESVRDMAEGLLKLYAIREGVPGYAFSPDTVWQHDFEDAFPYEETPDQWRAISEVKQDMEKPRPMDRLLCGDVGFGKTEVALRAAFKATADGRQVAVLVPTTILAQQHYNTFVERFKGFPMKVAVMSRFQSDMEQRLIAAGLKDGSVDVVIGTHRLLSQDIQFKNLGLVVVDEEQRFGVAQKERLKELKKEVDVLTLTATPIPRTLHMAMVGVRDMSVIETPPENRFPIRTYVVEHNDTLVREVILREIDRGGQVYFVHNRVQNIDDVTAALMRLVPEADIGVAHGQMPEDRLERVMLQFLAHEFDVLVCTSIIESGIDIPNVNTIIINDSDNFGLAQLYQLRGRVGRTNRVAYCYLLFRRGRVLTETAERRLAAIREFTSLGSGYKIAMRDLEIRGAGNLLGAEQHGHIAAVGFEMYCRLLEEAIAELKGKPREAEPPPMVIGLPVDAYMPESFVPDSRQKIEVYKKINTISSMEQAAQLAKELADRFGQPPPPVENLLTIAALKVLASELGVVSMTGERGEVVVKFAEGIRHPGTNVIKIARPFRGRVTLGGGRTQSIRIRTQGLSEKELLNIMIYMLTEMNRANATMSE